MQRITILTISLLFGLTATTALAQKHPKSALHENNPHLSKVSSHLLEARRQLKSGLRMNQVTQENRLLQAVGEQVQIEVRLNRLDAQIERALQSAGMSINSSQHKYAVVTGHIHPADLDKIAAINEVAVIHPMLKPRSRVGSVDNQADASMRADVARAAFSVDGSNLTVGVLSDSFHDTIGGTAAGASCGTNAGCDCILTGSNPQNSGDLPTEVTVLDNHTGGQTDEGAGMAELIYDVVPGSDIMFRTASGGEANFADGIAELVSCGSDVIVDDIIYLFEPMFQDGFVAQAAQDSFAAGVPYFSAAGNNAGIGVNQNFSDSDSGTNDTNFPISGADLHTFAGGNEFAEVTIPNNCSVTFILQWAEPFSGTLGSGATTDLDLHICTAEDPTTCNVGSFSSQGNCSGGTSGDPVEGTTRTNTSGAAETVYIAVDHYCGAGGADTTGDNMQFRIALYESCGSNITYEAGIFDQFQIYGHAAAEGAVAVGAVFYGEVDANGNLDAPPGQIDVEAFSALGGDIPIYFDGSGNPLAGAPVTRFKPEIVAPQGTNTTFFGNDIGFDADSFPNFFGTSAAAPHAAAVATLMLEASPDLSPAAVTQVLQASAIDAETAGVDALSGHGLVDANDAVQTVTNIGSGCIDTLSLFEQSAAGTLYFRACDLITVGDNFSVVPAAALTLEVEGGQVKFQPGFSLKQGATLNTNVVNSF